MARVKSTVAYVGTHRHEENLQKVQQVFSETVHSEVPPTFAMPLVTIYQELT